MARGRASLYIPPALHGHASARRTGLRAIAAAALAALGIAGNAAPASAAPPMGGQVYEGLVAKRAQDTVTLEVSKDGKRIRYLSLSFRRGCRMAGRTRGVSQLGLMGLRNLRVRAGRVSHRRMLRYPSTGGWLETRMSGRFVDGGARFTGTLRERMRNPKMRSRCDSGVVRFTASVPERVLMNGTFAGQTAQGRPLSLTIGRDGVTALTAEIALTCTNGETVVRPVEALREPVRVADDGGFQGATGSLQTETLLRGKATRNVVSGTFTATDSIERPEGDDTRVYTCRSGDVAFEARRR